MSNKRRFISLEEAAEEENLSVNAILQEGADGERVLYRFVPIYAPEVVDGVGNPIEADVSIKTSFNKYIPLTALQCGYVLNPKLSYEEEISVWVNDKGWPDSGVEDVLVRYTKDNLPPPTGEEVWVLVADSGRIILPKSPVKRATDWGGFLRTNIDAFEKVKGYSPTQSELWDRLKAQKEISPTEMFDKAVKKISALEHESFGVISRDNFRERYKRIFAESG